MRPQDPPRAFERDRPPARPRGRRLGVAAGAAAAALVSAGLVYWISTGEDHSLSDAEPAKTATAQPAYAPARADAGQVARAYEQLQEIYADQGTTGVMGFARSCADSLRADPGVLDFCLAFDIYAASLEGEDPQARAWQAQAGARDLALARSVLPPGQDAAARLAQVRELARQTSLEAPPAPEAAAPGQPVQPAAPAPPATGTPATAAPTAAAAAKPVHAGQRACRQRATAAQRTVCASPALREADRRLRLAYRRALAAGVDPRRLAHDQARFRAAVNAAAPNRAAVARLYHHRTRALELQVRKARAFAG